MSCGQTVPAADASERLIDITVELLEELPHPRVLTAAGPNSRDVIWRTRPRRSRAALRSVDPAHTPPVRPDSRQVCRPVDRHQRLCCRGRPRHMNDVGVRSHPWLTASRVPVALAATSASETILSSLVEVRSPVTTAIDQRFETELRDVRAGQSSATCTPARLKRQRRG
jgi:hypothetical protein